MHNLTVPALVSTEDVLLFENLKCPAHTLCLPIDGLGYHFGEIQCFQDCQGDAVIVSQSLTFTYF